MEAAVELFEGERVLWEGRPAQGLMLRAIDAFLIPFSLLWGGFAIFWNVMVWSSGFGDLFLKLWGIPFLIVGLYAIAGRFVLDLLIRRWTRYIVTDRHVVIVRGGPWGSTRSLAIKSLSALELDERRDGSGTVWLSLRDEWPWWMSRDWRIWQPTFDRAPHLIRIADARTVYALIYAGLEG